MARVVNYTCAAHGKLKHPIECGYGTGPAPEAILCPVKGCTFTATRYRNASRAGRLRCWFTVTEATYRRLKTYCQEQDVSVASVIDALTQDLGRKV